MGCCFLHSLNISIDTIHVVLYCFFFNMIVLWLSFYLILKYEIPFIWLFITLWYLFSLQKFRHAIKTSIHDRSVQHRNRLVSNLSDNFEMYTHIICWVKKKRPIGLKSIIKPWFLVDETYEVSTWRWFNIWSDALMFGYIG